MAENSAIEWTHHTFNGWRGCSKVHAGCTNCYAEVNYSVKMHGVKWGPDGTRVKLSDAGWKEPLKWNRDAQAAGERRRVFCASLADVFEDWQGPILNHNGCRMLACRDCGRMGSDGFTEVCPQCGRRDFQWLTMDDLRRDLFELIDATQMLDWLLLTKRPENVRKMWPETAPIFHDGEELPREQFRRHNVWLGTSISDQKTADEWVPRLKECRDLCKVLFLSCEPLLGPIDFYGDGLWCGPCPRCINRSPDFETNVVECRTCDSTGIGTEVEIDWVIVGGESGHNARPCDIAWIESIARDCDGAGVPLFVKQLGAHPTSLGVDLSPPLKDKKGGDVSEWPWPAIRQFPELAKV